MQPSKYGCLGWAVAAIAVVFVVQSPESAAGLLTTVFGWVGTAATSLGVFVEAVS